MQQFVRLTPPARAAKRGTASSEAAHGFGDTPRLGENPRMRYTFHPSLSRETSTSAKRAVCIFRAAQKIVTAKFSAATLTPKAKATNRSFVARYAGKNNTTAVVFLSKKSTTRKTMQQATCQTRKKKILEKKILSQARSTRRPSSPLMSEGVRWIV